MAHVAGHEVGRISGPLLKSNLQRTSDLAFETDLLYIAHTNGKIGIKNDAPAFELTVDGTTNTPASLIATNSAQLGNFQVTGTGFQAPTGDITIGLVDGLGNPKAGDIVMNELRTASLSFTNSTISSSDDIIIQPGPGTGIFRIPTDLKSYGDIHATGDITFDGNLLISGDNANEDTITIGGELDSNLVPDQTLTYNLGSNTQRWGHIYTNRILDLNDVAIQGDLSFNGIAVNLGIVNKWYVSTNGLDTSPGDHPNFAFATIQRAIQAVEESTAGPHEIHILAGEYEEVFPLEIPMNTTIKGFSLRSVTIKPTVATQNKDAFLLNEASMVSDLTVKDFYYDSVNDTGYAFRFAPNAALIGKSPYVQNVTVITKGTPITVTASSTFSVNSEENQPRGITFNNDGTKMFIVGAQGDDVNEYTLSVGFDLSSTVTFVDSFAVTQCPNPMSVKFNTDGTKMFVTGVGNNNVHEYALSTGFDVSTASFTQTLVTTVDNDNFGLDFNNDGTKMYITGNSTDSIYEFNLSSAFDISTATLNQSVYLNAIDDEPFGIEFNTDGTRMFIVGTKGNGVDEYTLSTPYDISTMTHMGFFHVGNNPSGIHISPDGTKMFIIGNGVDLVKSYDLGASYRVSEDNDPRGFAQGDAGKGVLLDASIVDPSSYSASMLFNAVTFITPGVDAVTVKNGARMEFIDCFTYFANRGVYMEHTLNQYTPSAGSYDPATGVMSLTIGSHSMRVGETITIANNSLTFTCAMDNHQTDHTYPRSTDPYSGKKVTITETTATTITCNVGVSSNTSAHLFKSATANAVTEGSMNEVRSIASANVYGNKGIEADGNGCLAYLISHNFAYIGVGKDVTNDVSLVNQFAEVLESNGAKVTFVSQDQGSDFRVGNNFFVDASKGTATIDVTGSDLTGSSLTIGRNNITFIDATKIETGNFRITNNTIQSIVNGINVTSAGGTINFAGNVNMQKDLTVSNNVTIGGSAINFGNDSNDTIDFSMDIDQDLVPSTDGAHNLGQINRQWKKLNNSKTVIEDIEIHNNYITAFNTNQDLTLRGSGTGYVKIGDLDFKTNISNAGGDVAINSNTATTNINSTGALELPIGTTGQDPATAQSLRFNSSLGNFVSYTSGPSILSGVTDFDKDTYISTASNQYTFFTGNNPTAQITGAGTLDAIAVSSNNQTKLDGNSITVGSNGGQGGVSANGAGRVLFDTSDFEIGNSDWYVTSTNSDLDFAFNGTVRNTYLHFDTTKAAVMPYGAQGVRPVNARQGELWWNETNSTLEVYTGTEWVTSVGSQTITVTQQFAEDLNVIYELILA